jgi:polyphosphate kinase 2 (PPK2 family)
MTKTNHHDDPPSADEYKRTLYDLRVQLVKLQNEVIRKGLRILVVLEGRDGAGKDGAIKRIVKNLSPRETRVVALAKPSDREESSWSCPICRSGARSSCSTAAGTTARG